MDVTLMREDAFDRTTRLIDAHGPRLAGTKACLDTADALHEELDAFADRAHKEDFIVRKGAFLGWIRLLVVAYAAGVAFIWLDMPWIAFALALASMVVLVLQFFLYLPLLDGFYPKKTARNVYGVLEPTGDVKRQIIVSGHHDSAHVFNFFIHQPKLYNLRVNGSIVFVLTLVIVAMASAVATMPTWALWTTRGIITAGLLLVGQMWFFVSKQATPGAGDNLIASAIALTLGKHFKGLRDKGEGLKHTRLIVASFDAEEEGLRGARAFVKRHVKMLKAAPTTVLNMDCLYDAKELFFLTSDLNGFVPLDKPLAVSLTKTADTLGIKVKTQPLAFLTGGTDAAEFAKKSVSATTLIGMPWTNQARSLDYHTPSDTIDKVSPKVVEATLRIFERHIIESDRK